MTNTQTGASTRDAGPDDICDGAEAITMPWSEVMSISLVGRPQLPFVRRDRTGWRDRADRDDLRRTRLTSTTRR